MISLSSRFPQVDADHIVDQFTPPPRFSKVRFENYLPNPNEPTQKLALTKIVEFAKLDRSIKHGLFKRTGKNLGRGIYLDGGFGVGKTHLLAALFYEHPGENRYASFVEYTNLVGALGFEKTLNVLCKFNLICIDEFELDDPGDTVLMSTLLNRLVQSGVNIAATSNTLPDRLGEGRFAADDFIREIQGLAGHFQVIRIEGQDFRHREGQIAAMPKSAGTLIQNSSEFSFDEMQDLDLHLQKIHPSTYSGLFRGINRVQINNLKPISHQANALRWVVFIDRMYDLEIPFSFTGCEIDELFPAEMKRGGYRKKYLRAISRLSALSRE